MGYDEGGTRLAPSEESELNATCELLEAHLVKRKTTADQEVKRVWIVPASGNGRNCAGRWSSSHGPVRVETA